MNFSRYGAKGARDTGPRDSIAPVPINTRMTIERKPAMVLPSMLPVLFSKSLIGMMCSNSVRFGQVSQYGGQRETAQAPAWTITPFILPKTVSE
ncbi:MAG: hypothetical protein VCD66_08060, partial [Alphaproteobacteria bacterium]